MLWIVPRCQAVIKVIDMASFLVESIKFIASITGIFQYFGNIKKRRNIPYIIVLWKSYILFENTFIFQH